MATVKSYDQRCFDLAMEFLKDDQDLFTALHVHLLALEIQQTIEDEIYFMREHPELYPLLNTVSLSKCKDSHIPMKAALDDKIGCIRCGKWLGPAQ